MSDPADDYYAKKAEELLVVQSKKREKYPYKAALADQFKEMQEAYSWFYERKW